MKSRDLPPVGSPMRAKFRCENNHHWKAEVIRTESMLGCSSVCSICGLGGELTELFTELAEEVKILRGIARLIRDSKLTKEEAIEAALGAVISGTIRHYDLSAEEMAAHVRAIADGILKKVSTRKELPAAEPQEIEVEVVEVVDD